MSMIFLLIFLAVPVSALELEIPDVPGTAQGYMPNPESDFGAGLWQVIRKAVAAVRPDLQEAARVCVGIGCGAALLSVFRFLPGQSAGVTELTCVAVVSVLLLSSTGSMIRLAENTVKEISEYARLFFPVLTTAMAAEGKGGTSAALYAGTMICNTLLSSAVTGLLIPVVYLYLALAIGCAMTDQEILGKILTSIRQFVSWGMKMILYAFTGYMAISGAISGTADATALKMTKMAISGMVPAIGGILANASEAVLIGAAAAKQAAGLYGVFAFLALWLKPFLTIGSHYLVLKLTGAICGIFDVRKVSDLLERFGVAMGILLAMTGTVSVMLMISITCFLKGVG